MAKRSVDKWNQLSDAQRKRYIGAARTGKLTGTPITGTPSQIARKARTYYVQGGSLTSARGKHPISAPKKFAPPTDALKAAQRGEATPKQLQQLRNWQKSRAPKWIKDAGVFSEDTAALLVGINLQPQNWKSIEVYRQPDGTVVVYIDSKRGGPRRKLVLPDSTSLQELVMFVEGRNEREGGGVAVGATFVRQFGYQRQADGEKVLEVPTKRQGNSLPRKSRK